jgi:hypothetical protein
LNEEIAHEGCIRLELFGALRKTIHCGKNQDEQNSEPGFHFIKLSHF